jgi:PAS domain S-box-containing protein
MQENLPSSKITSILPDSFLKHDTFRQRPVALKVILPLICSALATCFAINPMAAMGYRSPFLLYFAAVLISSAYGGCWSALVATVASAIGAIIYVLPQHRQGSEFYFAIMLFLLEGLALAFLFRLIEEFQSRIQKNQARFKGMIEQSAEGFLLINGDGLITYAAPVAGELLGYTTEELLNMSLQELVNPDEKHSFEFRFLKLRNDYGHTINFLQRFKTREGDWKWIEGSARNLLKDERVGALVIHYRNVSERMAQNKQQEDFVHMASHELKSPITALKGYAQLMRLNHRKESREKDHYVLDRIDMQLNKLLGLIDDMLDITRIKAGELNYHFSRFSFNDCVKETLEAIQNTTTTHELKLLEKEVPVLFGDKDKISQVINNLISNAIKYSPGQNTVEVRIEKDDTYVYLYVLDHGIGIPKEKQKKVFERFYRVDRLSKNTIEGLGLGLYIAMEIISKHQGKMGLESEDGDGAEFWFALPIKTDEQTYSDSALKQYRPTVLNK